MTLRHRRHNFALPVFRYQIAKNSFVVDLFMFVCQIFV